MAVTGGKRGGGEGGVRGQRAGLDALDLAGRPGGQRRRLAIRFWNRCGRSPPSRWCGYLGAERPQRLEEDLPACYWPDPGNLWDQAKTGPLSNAIGNTLESAVIGFAIALLIGVGAAAVPASPRFRRRSGH